MTLSRAEALKAAAEILAGIKEPYNPTLGIDHELILEKEGFLIVPYNGEEYLETRDPMEKLVGCWPILVDLATGEARIATDKDRHLWSEQ
ncbi:YrhB domain-containing protein [Streptomyces diastatochromogenes]|uniref:YrhB domain-containing protein n=1 Tax=Streptomyces diastatochromogenes TaxID=42236 RepID=UPI002F26CFF1